MTIDDPKAMGVMNKIDRGRSPVGKRVNDATDSSGRLDTRKCSS
jgi:hypothetical protein